MIGNFRRFLHHHAQWVISRGPSCPMPQLPISWPLFVLGIGIDRAWYLLDHLFLKSVITPFVATLISIAIIFTLLGLLRWKGLSPHALGVSSNRSSKEILVGLSFSTLYLAVFMVNNTLAGSPPELMWLIALVQNFSYTYALDTARWAGELFLKALVVGVYEEIVFRGWMLTFLLTRWGVGKRALAVSAAFFGLTHAHVGWWAVIVTTFFGYLFGLLYLWRKNLVVAIVLHTLWNWAVWLGLLGRTN